MHSIGWLALCGLSCRAAPYSFKEMKHRLKAERARAAQRFSHVALKHGQHIVRGAGAPAALGARLTSAVLTGAPYIVGVTGGSSTVGQFAWPWRLETWLRGLNVTGAVVRNAAHSWTSQLVTAPCIQALVGDNIDLLLWEFAMNDELPFIGPYRTSQMPEFHIRQRVAEAYIRQAAQLEPGALGFVQFGRAATIPRQRDEVPRRSTCGTSA